MADAPQFPWIDLAGRALTHAVAERGDVAHRCVNRIAELFGADEIPHVMLAWVDTTIGRVYPDGPPSTLESMAFWNEGDTHVTGVDQVPPAVRWAGRFYMARLLDDEDQARALMGSVTSDLQWVDNVAAVLNVCATTIRHFAPLESAQGGAK